MSEISRGHRAMTRTRVTGMALMAAAMLLVPGLDVIAKLLMERLSPLEVTASRFVMQTLVLLPLVIRPLGLAWPKPSLLIPGFFLACALLAFNHAIQQMPIANALAIFFVEPLILTVLAWLLLREELGRHRLIAVMAGLLGAAMILRPNVAEFGLLSFYPLATAFFFAFYMLTTRRTSQKVRPTHLQFWTGVSASLVLLTALVLTGGIKPAALRFLNLSGHELFLLICLGSLAAVAHQLIVRALSLVEANTLAPFQYLELVSAVALGWLIFVSFPDPWTWLGAAIVVGSGLAVLRMEGRT